MWRLEKPSEAPRFAALERTLTDLGRRRAAFFVPGRIEVLGKHTDYAGGRSLTCATSQGIALVALARDDRRMTVTDVGRGLDLGFELDPGLVPEDGRWSSYPQTVARRLARNFPGLLGVDIAFTSDLERAAGLSSSSALVVAFALALAWRNRLDERPELRAEVRSREDLAAYLGTIENGRSFGTLAGDRGVGTFGGSQDHTAILCASAGELSQYRYAPVVFERAVTLPEDLVFAVASSGVRAKKTGGARAAYNRASRLAQAAAEAWRQATGGGEPHLAAIARSGGGERLRDVLARSRHPEFTAAELLARAEHFLAESEEIVPAAGDALAAGDLDTFGRLVDRSQARGEKLLGNQVPETVFLAASSRSLGAVAASAFGAGFGGAVWALVRRQEAAAFLERLAQGYRERFPERRAAAFFLTEAGPAAAELTDRGNAETKKVKKSP